MGGGGSSGNSQVAKAEPWSGITPYLLGSGPQAGGTMGGATPTTTGFRGFLRKQGDASVAQTPGVAGGGSIPGLFPSAADMFSKGGFTPEMQAAYDAQRARLAAQAPAMQQLSDVGRWGYAGGFDTALNPVGGVNAGAIGTPQETAARMISAPERVTSANVDPTQAFSSFGGANPQNALAQMLSGQVDTSTLNPVIEGLNQRLGQSFNEQALPNIRNSAAGLGQYGSSRQGIAEGIAARGLAQAMSDTGANLTNQAYQQAQQNRYGTANALAGLGINNAQTNAARDLAAQQFNTQMLADVQGRNAANALNAQQFNANLLADVQGRNVANALNAGQFNSNLGLQTNAQRMANMTQNLQNRTMGANLFAQGNAMQNANFNDTINALQAPQNYNWQNLQRYAGILNPGLEAGKTTTQTTNQSSNPITGALGGAASGFAMTGDPWGAAIGGGLGLLGAL